MLNTIRNSEIKDVTGCQLVTACMSVDDYVHQLTQANTIDEVHRLCTSIRYRYGFDFYTVFSTFSRPDKKPLIFTIREYDNAWTRHYQDKQYLLIDPSIRIAESKVSPYVWSYTDRHSVKESFLTSELSLLHEALDFGMRGVLNVPIRGAGGNQSLIRFVNFVDGQDTQASGGKEPDKKYVLFFLSSLIHEALERVLAIGATSDLLSEREKEILVQSAHGYNPAAISDRLRIAEYTVCNHLRNIRYKLGVRTTTHALGKAISNKLITL